MVNNECMQSSCASLEVPGIFLCCGNILTILHCHILAQTIIMVSTFLDMHEGHLKTSQ